LAIKTLQPIEEKITTSKEVIEKALDLYGEKMALAWTGGKDSTTILHLLRSISGGKVPIPVLNIDTSVKFKEIYEFRDKLAQEWQLDLRIEGNAEAIRTIQIAANKEECCFQLKTSVINMSLEKFGWQALITGLRWDEQPDRARDAYFSSRENPHHMRVQPIVHFTEMDIWHYIKNHDVPYCKLYRRGYRSIGCEPCTKIGIEGTCERAGRDQHKEEIMTRLRSAGYF
jgi:phosphoadenosine phosphosulfate reductase